jgi:hypothetical protein
VLQDGEAYIYACDAHPAAMHETFSIHTAGYGRRTRTPPGREEPASPQTI